MISAKTLATLFLIILNVQRAASTSPDDSRKPNSSNQPTLRVRKQGHASKSEKTFQMLQDAEDTVTDVEAQGGRTEETNISQGQLVPQINKEFEGWINQVRYDKIYELGNKMKPEEFFKQLYPVIKTIKHYRAFFRYFENHKMVASFYIHGDIGVVREAIIESKVYDDRTWHVKDGDLETALSLTFKENRHDRFIDLLKFRQEATAKIDKQLKRARKLATFECFISDFIFNLAPWEDDTALRRFFALRGDELRTKHSDILDILCQKLVDHLKLHLNGPKVENLLIDLVGQPLLFTTMSFTNGFLWMVSVDGDYSNFIKYGWSEAIQEALKRECSDALKPLWEVMQKEHPDLLHEEFPDTADERAIVCKRFPTKQQREDEWGKWALKNAKIFLTKLESLLFILDLVPSALLPIIAEYAISLADIDSTVSRK